MNYKTLYKSVSLITKFSTRICILALILCFCQIAAFSQVKNNSSTLNQDIDDEANIEQIGPTLCEMLLAALDSDLYSKQKLDEGSKVIIIFRMHKKETDKHYNARKEGLASWFDRRYPKRVIYVKGEVVNDDLGRADIYFNGKKVFIIKFNYRFIGVCSGDHVG